MLLYPYGSNGVLDVILPCYQTGLKSGRERVQVSCGEEGELEDLPT